MIRLPALQITIDIAVIRDVLEPLAIFIVSWLLKIWITGLKVTLNEIITDNVNRISSDLAMHIDEKFKQHEINAFQRIDALERTVQHIQR
jgi:hypothetical protein